MRTALRLIAWLQYTVPVLCSSLPDSVLVGYASQCAGGKVRQAISDGVNVVIWAFWALAKEDVAGFPRISTNLDIGCIEALKKELDGGTIHLASIGGWNGFHLEEQYSSEAIYDAWRNWGGRLFDGIDWDLEGNDRLDSPMNVFGVETLHRMGEISRLAHQGNALHVIEVSSFSLNLIITDGFIVSMAPPQSYLDFGTSRFSRFVNLTYPTRTWHSEFSYYGANVYSYLLAKYGDYFDIVSVQLYESYSRANYEISQLGDHPSSYLDRFVKDHLSRGEAYYVHFSEDQTVSLPSQLVSVPMNKLVIGLANGWASADKVVYFSPHDVKQAITEWCLQGSFQPRGFVFWTIDLEGENGVFMASGLGEALALRCSKVVGE